jgi:hypothetical protein
MQDFVAVKTVQLIDHVDQLELGLMALRHEYGIIEYRTGHLGKIDRTEQRFDRWHNAVSSPDWGTIESFHDHNNPTENNPRPCRKMEMRDFFYVLSRSMPWYKVGYPFSLCPNETSADHVTHLSVTLLFVHGG